MTPKFISDQLIRYRSECKQEREYLAQALKAKDWRMQSLAENNLAQATRQFMYYWELSKLEESEYVNL